MPAVPPPMPPSAMTPSNCVEALVTVSVFEPSATLPVPSRVWIEAPVVVCEMSNVPPLPIDHMARGRDAASAGERQCRAAASDKGRDDRGAGKGVETRECLGSATHSQHAAGPAGDAAIADDTRKRRRAVGDEQEVRADQRLPGTRQVWIAAPPASCEISNVPLLRTGLELEIEPLPAKASVAPELMVVSPV